MSSSRRALVLIPALALVATGCGSDSGSAGESGGPISIVASTNVYGDIAERVAGDDAEVTSIITSAAQDPHEYEATVRDRLAVSEADLVIENGGGYDTFMEGLREDSEAHAMVAVELSGLLPEGEEAGHDHSEEEHSDEEGEEEHSHEEGESHEGHDHVEGFNEHVWYDVHTMEELGAGLVDELSELDPDNADAFQANYDDLLADLEGIESSLTDMRTTTEGKSAAITEPVPVYMLEEAGLSIDTPEDFSEAVEEGTDVPPRALQETLDLVDSGDVAVLAYNDQTADGTTEEVRAAAEEAGVPVVDFSETLPEGMGYVEWQQGNVAALSAALEG